MSKLLFDDDFGEEDIGFKTNIDFARTYNKYRQKELLKKLKDKNECDDSHSSSDSDSSDDDEVAYNPQFDEEFLKTLSSLKRRDTAIYEKSTTFFEDENILETPSNLTKKKDEKKLTIKQYEQTNLLKHGGVYEDDEEIGAGTVRPESPTLNEEQKMIKNEFKRVLNSSDSDDEGDFGGLFTKRQKTKIEEEEDDKEQKKWSAEHEERKGKNIDEIWSGAKLSKDDKFLRDYILSNGYADKDDDEIPTYEEILSDDDFEEKQTEFEHKYNFRYEDPDQEFIKRYPRTIDSSVRKVDNRRKEKRVERAERKEREKKEKFNEIEMLKELKRKEIEDKIAQLQTVTGTDAINIEDIDLDDDFDPDEYDKKMNKIFNSEYYQVDEGDEKPECPSDIEDLKVENYDEYEPEHGDGAHCEDDDFNMDCDYEEKANDQKKSFQDEIIESTRGRKRRKRKSKFTEALEQKKPVFDPNHKTFDEYLDEYYKLDCEDIIGDVKCRFKYTETVPCDYGLSVEEILLAKNKELNAWASLKKATQIRPEHVEKNDQAIFEKKARNEMLKRKILLSLFEPSDTEDQPEVKDANKSLKMVKDLTKEPVRERNALEKKKKKKRNKTQTATKSLHETTNETIGEHSEKDTKLSQSTNETPISNPKITKQQKKSADQTEKKKLIPSEQKSSNVNGAIKKFNDKHTKSKDLKKVANKTIDKKKCSNGISDERLKAFGINPKKFAKKQKYGQKTAVPIQSSKNARIENTKHVQKAKFDSKLRNKLKKVLKA